MWSCSHIVEADCKHQFSNVDPKMVEEYLNQSLKWLKSKRQWRSTQMCWSVHKTESMDRAGKATICNFSLISHVELVEFITFCLWSDNFCWAVGRAWQCLFAIPMEGSFSAQSAGFYCIWPSHPLKARSRDWGTPPTSPQGYPVWTSAARRTMALAQFRGNIIIAFAGPGAIAAVRDVCSTRSNIWNLPVLCPCMQRPGDPCTETCMGHELRALRI